MKKSIIINLFFWFTIINLPVNSFAQSFQKADSLELILASTFDKQEQIEILNELGQFLKYNQPEKALDYTLQSLELVEEIQDKSKKVKVYLLLGSIKWQQNDLTTALNFGLKAQELALELNKEIDFAYSLLMISAVQTDFGNYTQSTDLNFQALKIFEENNDKAGISKTLSIIGYVSFEQKEYDKALSYFVKALNLSKELNDKIEISKNLNNIAAIYGSKGDFKNYAHFIRQALEINKTRGMRFWEGINYFNLAATYRHDEKLDSAILFYNKALDIYNDFNKTNNIISVYSELAIIYANKNEYEKAVGLGLKAYELAKENNDIKGIQYSIKRLRFIYSYQENFEKAFEYSVLENQYRDSLDLEKSSKHLAQIELMHQYEKESHKRELKQKSREFNFIIGGISIVFLFLIIITILIYRYRIKVKNSKIKSAKLESELEIKNRELTYNVMSLIKKNEVLSGIANKLIEIKEEAIKEETKTAIHKVAKELHKSSDDEIWNDFEIRFKQVHGDFYKKLLQQFPDLSPNEQKLCAFLRLKLSTKEISELTGQRINTIEIARTRLRKKLGITNTQTNLINFIAKL